MANDGEVVGILERNGVEIGNWKFGSGLDQFTVRQRALGMTVNHLPALGFARVGTDFPLLGRRSHEHFTRGCACAAQRQPGAGDAAAPSGTEVIDFRIGGRLLDLHLLPVYTQLFREDHGKRRHDALAHFRFTENERDLIVRSDADPGIEGVGTLLFLLLGLIGESSRREMEANDERDTSSGTGLKKIAAIYGWSDCHGTPLNL